MGSVKLRGPRPGEFGSALYVLALTVWALFQPGGAKFVVVSQMIGFAVNVAVARIVARD